MLTFLEIIVVILVVMSLAAIAALGSIGARKRNRPLQNSKVLCLIGSAGDLHAG
jgi:type II secretory pathway pseudopilin PulG